MNWPASPAAAIPLERRHTKYLEYFDELLRKPLEKVAHLNALGVLHEGKLLVEAHDVGLGVQGDSADVLGGQAPGEALHHGAPQPRALPGRIHLRHPSLEISAI